MGGRVEGRLAFRECHRSRFGRLIDVSFVDASGKDLLAQMWQGGADFVADSPLMKQVSEEVTGSPEGWGNPAHLTGCAYTSKGEKL